MLSRYREIKQQNLIGSGLVKSIKRATHRNVSPFNNSRNSAELPGVRKSCLSSKKSMKSSKSKNVIRKSALDKSRTSFLSSTFSHNQKKSKASTKKSKLNKPSPFKKNKNPAYLKKLSPASNKVKSNSKKKQNPTPKSILKTPNSYQKYLCSSVSDYTAKSGFCAYADKIFKDKSRLSQFSRNRA